MQYWPQRGPRAGRPRCIHCSAVHRPIGTAAPTTSCRFDAGPAGEVWRLNAQRLGLSPAGIEAVVLSHWHMDHSGGLPEVAAMISESRSQLAQEGGAASLPPPAVFDVHPHRPACRGAMLPSGQPVPFNQDPGLEELAVSRSCFRVWGVTVCVWLRWILAPCAMPRSDRPRWHRTTPAAAKRPLAGGGRYMGGAAC